MRIWLLKIGEPLPTDSANARLLRTGILAEEIAHRGHEVTWWTSSFDHRRKCQRFDETNHIELKEHYRLIALRSPGYTKNISLRRLIDHRIVAKEFTQQSRTLPQPDIVFSALPTLELSFAAARFAKEHQIPFVVDVRDMWPDVFERAIPRYGRKLAQPLLKYFARMATNVCQQATAITGHTSDFVEWGLQKAARPATALDRHFPFAYREQPVDAKLKEEAYRYWQQLGVSSNDGCKIVSFIGTLGHQFDMSPVIAAARKLEKTGKFHFVLCGDGENRSRLASQTRGIPSIIWPGWIDAPKIQALLEMSSLALAPYQQTSDFVVSMPNKVIEYLSTGTPVLTSLDRSVMRDVLTQQNCGMSYANCHNRLTELIQELLHNPQMLKKMSENASSLFRESFSAEKVYGDMIEHLSRIANQEKIGRSPSLAA